MITYAILPLRDANLCVECQAISNSRGECCPNCGCAGTLISLARVLNPSPEIGKVTYIYAPKEC